MQRRPSTSSRTWSLADDAHGRTSRRDRVDGHYCPLRPRSRARSASATIADGTPGHHRRHGDRRRRRRRRRRRGLDRQRRDLARSHGHHVVVLQLGRARRAVATITWRVADDSGNLELAPTASPSNRLSRVMVGPNSRRRCSTPATSTWAMSACASSPISTAPSPRCPLLQGRRQHRHAHRQPVHLDRHAPGHRHVHERDGHRLAAAQLRQSREHHRGDDVRRVLLRAARALLRQPLVPFLAAPDRQQDSGRRAAARALWSESPGWQNKVAGAYGYDQFTVDWERQQVQCPQGKWSWPWREPRHPSRDPWFPPIFAPRIVPRVRRAPCVPARLTKHGSSNSYHGHSTKRCNRHVQFTPPRPGRNAMHGVQASKEPSHKVSVPLAHAARAIAGYPRRICNR